MPLARMWREHWDGLTTRRMLWMFVSKRSDSYVPGFEGTFREALEEATIHAAYWKSRTEVWEVDPANYRRMGGLKTLWAVIDIPKESPLRAHDLSKPIRS
jgi:hypothetical protein